MNILLKHPQGHSIKAGPGENTRVMALTGTNRARGIKEQTKKISVLATMANGPDIVADLSLVKIQTPLWQIALESGFTAATLPIYSVTRHDKKIDSSELLDIAIHHMMRGVGIITIHPTPTHELIKLSQNRLVPWTSRGGGIVIEDMLASNRNQNIYLTIMPNILKAALHYGVVISIGASFRSANIFDSLDVTQMREIEAQLELAKLIEEFGVGVIIESPGHAKPTSIKQCAELLASSKFPIMPLGPIPTDTAIGNDHIAAAIGATLMGIEGAAHILAAVTREEHQGNIPSIESTIEAVHAARVAAHIIDIHQLNDTKSDYWIAQKRAEQKTCLIDKSTPGCSRCAMVCPLR